VTGAEDVLTLILTGPEQVAHGLLGCRHPDRRELTRAEEAGQLAGVAAVGLAPVTRSSRRERGRDDGGVDAQRGQLAIWS
jgi:hypothetical protein